MLASPRASSTSQPQIALPSQGGAASSAARGDRMSRAEIAGLMSPPASSLKNMITPRQGKSMPKISSESRNAAA